MSKLLDDITTEWLAGRRNGSLDDDAEQSRIRKHAAAAIGCICGDDPTRSSRASELVREIITHKHIKESRASRRSD